jgi:L-alanine-DL-glutamate epimerase-like enolase superfamily enzyme
MNAWPRRDFLASAAVAASAQQFPQSSLGVSKIEIHLPVGLLRIRLSGDVEGCCLGLSERTAEVIISQCAPAIVRQDPLRRERLWQDLASKDLPVEARAAIDIALWDLAGHILQIPVFRLASGFRESIPVCRVSSRTNRIPELAGQAARAAAAGYAAFQDRFTGTAESVSELASELRDAAGEAMPLIHSAGAPYTPDQALQIGRVLQRSNFDAFDLPLSVSDGRALGELATSLDLPVASPVSADGVARALTAQVPDILRIDAMRHIGFTGILKTLRAAEAFGVSCAITGPGPLGGLVHAHAIAVSRSARYFEEVVESVEPPLVQDPPAGPAWTLPNAPGFGAVLNWPEIEKRTARVLRA